MEKGFDRKIFVPGLCPGGIDCDEHRLHEKRFYKKLKAKMVRREFKRIIEQDIEREREAS